MLVIQKLDGRFLLQNYCTFVPVKVKHSIMKDFIFQVVRGGCVESFHKGAYVVVQGNKVTRAGGEIHSPVFLRSSAKPFQALPVVRFGAADKFKFTPAELAIMTSSHRGAPIHVRAVKSILSKIGLEAKNLLCGADLPSRDSIEGLLRKGLKPTAIHHNCSGKHAGMLASSIYMGWSLKNYQMSSHPIQKEIFEIICEFSGETQRSIQIGIDGCGVPTYAMPLVLIARMFANFGETRDPHTQRVLKAMASNPNMMGKPCDSLIAISRGRIVAKGGAQALMCLTIPEENVGIAIKTYDGSTRPEIAVIVKLLEGLVDSRLHSKLKKLVTNKLVNNTGQTVGKFVLQI